MSSETLSDRRVWLLAAFLILFGSWFAWSRWDRTPQIGTDEQVFKTVDALFTAISTRDPSRLESCAKRLSAHKGSGRLPGPSAALLDSIIDEARGGQWKTAAERLYATMLSQRRQS